MNRIDFMNRLSALLSDIPEEERKEAVEYYNDYLNDAGVENEEEVLEALGTPEELAMSIREGLNMDAAETGEFSERGYQTSQKGGFFGENHNGLERRGKETGGKEADGKENGWKDDDRENFAGRSGNGRAAAENALHRRYHSGKKKGMSGGMIALLVILGILAAPVVIPLAFAVFGVLLSLVVVAVVLAVTFLFVGVVCIAAGIIAFFQGAAGLFSFPAGAVFGMGISLLTIGIGILLTLFISWLLVKVFPKVFRAVVDFFSRLLHRKGGDRT